MSFNEQSGEVITPDLGFLDGARYSDPRREELEEQGDSLWAVNDCNILTTLEVLGFLTWKMA